MPESFSDAEQWVVTNWKNLAAERGWDNSTLVETLENLDPELAAHFRSQAVSATDLPPVERTAPGPTETA